jgi:hypothetical protein
MPADLRGGNAVWSRLNSKVTLRLTDEFPLSDIPSNDGVRRMPPTILFLVYIMGMIFA